MRIARPAQRETKKQKTFTYLAAMYSSYGEGAGVELTVGGGDRRAAGGGDTLGADDATCGRKPAQQAASLRATRGHAQLRYRIPVHDDERKCTSSNPIEILD